jgi:hypothetical protein
MGRKSIDRTGEKRINNFGSEMIIVGYEEYADIDVYFPEYNWTAKNRTYGTFKKGKIRCPYERTVYGVGYIGEGKYKTRKNGKHTKCYQTWTDMLKRCYDEKYHEKHPTYKNCKVSEEWLCFQNFAKWYYDNYYEVKGERMHLDKDILIKRNKIYSPETCVFAPDKINILFVKSDSKRGDNPIGVNYHKRVKKYQVNCHIFNFKTNKTKGAYLGYYETREKAFEVYKQFKENYIKKVADYYKAQIPTKLYNALYNYEVEIND